MIENEGFYLQNTIKMNKKYQEDNIYIDFGLRNCDRIIIDNNKSVGVHCLTFLKTEIGIYIE